MVDAVATAARVAATSEPLTVSKAEAGRMLGVHPETVTRMPAAKTGKLRLGRRTLFVRAKLIELVTQLHAEQAGSTTGGGCDGTRC
jgi:hypothetical protein